MTVAELIEKLKELPQDAVVVQWEQERGWTVVDGPQEVRRATVWFGPRDFRAVDHIVDIAP